MLWLKLQLTFVRAREREQVVDESGHAAAAVVDGFDFGNRGQGCLCQPAIQALGVCAKCCERGPQFVCCISDETALRLKRRADGHEGAPCQPESANPGHQQGGNSADDEDGRECGQLMVACVQALADVQSHMREDIDKVDDPQFKALFETSAEVLGGLIKAFDDYDRKNESAWRK